MHQWRYGFIIPAAKKTVAKTDVKLKLLYENSPEGRGSLIRKPIGLGVEKAKPKGLRPYLRSSAV
jgi:hypothetical protein